MINSPVIDVLSEALARFVAPGTPIAPSTTLEELGLDSLTLVSAVSQVETAYDVQLPSEELVSLLAAASVESLAEALTSALVQSGARLP